MTLLQFREKLKKLLREAENSGLEVEDFCEIAEYVLENGWGKEDENE